MGVREVELRATLSDEGLVTVYVDPALSHRMRTVQFAFTEVEKSNMTIRYIPPDPRRVHSYTWPGREAQHLVVTGNSW